MLQASKKQLAKRAAAEKIQELQLAKIETGKWMLLLMATSEPAGKTASRIRLEGGAGGNLWKLIDSDVAVWDLGPRWMTKCLAKAFTWGGRELRGQPVAVVRCKRESAQKIANVEINFINFPLLFPIRATIKSIRFIPS